MYNLEKFNYPIPGSRLPDFTEELRMQNLKWADKFGLIQTDSARRKLDMTRVDELVARSHPNADFDKMLLFTHFISWLFLSDDHYDEGPLGYNPLGLRRAFDGFLDVVRCRPAPEVNPFTDSLVDIMDRFSMMAPPEWRERLFQSMTLYYSGCVDEATSRLHPEMNSLETYIRLRTNSIGMYPALDLVEIENQSFIDPLCQ